MNHDTPVDVTALVLAVAATGAFLRRKAHASASAPAPKLTGPHLRLITTPPTADGVHPSRQATRR